ncbi:hypothetical protein [Calidithermus roseus]|uniref:hypothetical protein n=1 Tax=Calidithermus roseus TaxID=1644118 RepID=UPI0011C45179|nr:hypothetical protein [Calidithermus roseus]
MSKNPDGLGKTGGGQGFPKRLGAGIARLSAGIVRDGEPSSQTVEALGALPSATLLQRLPF